MRQQHVRSLDGLRAIAVTLVLFAHANQMFDRPMVFDGLSGFVARLLGAGWVGVDLFFVLSGFLITGSLLDAREKPHYFRNFYMKRVLRIMPVYYGYLILVLAVARLSPGFAGLRPATIPDTASLFTYLYNFRVAFTEEPVYYAHHFWSLCVEEHFYLFWPVCVLLLSRRQLMWVCVLGIAFSFACRVAVVRIGDWLEVAYLVTPCRVDGLLAGAFAAVASRDGQMSAAVRRFAPWVAGACASAAFGIFAWQGHFFDFVDHSRAAGPEHDSAIVLTFGILALSLGFSSLLVVTVNSRDGSRWKRWMESERLGKVGLYSYGMYVLHILVMVIFNDLATRLCPSVLEAPGWVAKPAFVVFLFLVSYWLGGLSYRYFERPFRRIKSRYETP